MNKKFIDNVNLKNKNVLLRVDFNVPMDKEKKKITNHKRINATLPTINHLIQQDINNLVILSHLGRPKGKIVPELSLKLVQEYLEKKLGTRSIFFSDKPIFLLKKLVEIQSFDFLKVYM